MHVGKSGAVQCFLWKWAISSSKAAVKVPFNYDDAQKSDSLLVVIHCLKQDYGKIFCSSAEREYINLDLASESNRLLQLCSQVPVSFQ